jgi:hypothetical protein
MARFVQTNINVDISIVAFCIYTTPTAGEAST